MQKNSTPLEQSPCQLEDLKANYELLSYAARKNIARDFVEEYRASRRSFNNYLNRPYHAGQDFPVWLSTKIKSYKVAA